MTWGDYKAKLRGRRTLPEKVAVSDSGMDPKCPKCGSPMYWRDAAGLTGMHPEGAWECSNQRCWNMLTPGELAPDVAPPHPDTGQSDLTLPEGWGTDERCPSCGSPVQAYQHCPGCGARYFPPGT